MRCDRQPRLSRSKSAEWGKRCRIHRASYRRMLRRGACPEPPYILKTRPVAQRTEEMYYRTCHSPCGHRQSVSWNKGMWPLESVPLKHDCAVRSKEPIVSKHLVVVA